MSIIFDCGKASRSKKRMKGVSSDYSIMSVHSTRKIAEQYLQRAKDRDKRMVLAFPKLKKLKRDYKIEKHSDTAYVLYSKKNTK